VTTHTEADAAAERLSRFYAAPTCKEAWAVYPATLGHSLDVDRDRVMRSYLPIRTENARLAADLAAARAERDEAVAKKWEALKRHYAADTGDIEKERDALAQKVSAMEARHDFGWTERMAAEVEAANAERNRMREALAWAVGFIRCNLPNTSAGYEDMRNAEDLVKGVSMCGEFHRLSCRAEVAESQLAEARQAAADWRLLCSCGLISAQYLAVCVAKADDPDYQRMIWRHCETIALVEGGTAEVVTAARRLAGPHLNPSAEGGAK